jgi:large subunit ribosomal protein L10
VVLKIEDKKAIVAELAEVASESISVVAADYRGLTVSEMTLLRTQSRQQNVKMRVYRNTLARRAFQDTRFAG